MGELCCTAECGGCEGNRQAIFVRRTINISCHGKWGPQPSGRTARARRAGLPARAGPSSKANRVGCREGAERGALSQRAHELFNLAVRGEVASLSPCLRLGGRSQGS